MNEIMLDIRGLKKHFAVPGGFLSRRAGLIRAVDGVLDIWSIELGHSA